MFIGEFIRKLLYSEGMTPLPTKIIFTLFLSMLFGCITMSAPFSYSPQLVKSFGYTEVQTGTYAGILAASLYCSFIFGSFFWGYISDAHGKRFSALCTSIGLMCTTFAFGFSYNYEWCLAWRLGQGLFMGLIGTVKSLITDVCDDSNLGLAMSIVMSAYNTGLLVGPFISGLMSFPTEQYPDIFGNDLFLKIFPVVLPNSIVAFGYLLVAVLVIRTLPRQKYNTTSIERKSEAIDCKECPEHYNNISVQLTSHGNSSERESDAEDATLISKQSKALYLKEKIAKSNMFTLFRCRECLLACMLYGIYSLIRVVYEEIFVIFAATSKEYGGMAFSPSEIGTVLLATALSVFPLIIFAVPKVLLRFGSKKVFIISSLFLGTIIAFFPAVSLVRNNAVKWFTLILLQLACHGIMGFSFIAANLFVNNSVPQSMLGMANGLAMSIAAAAGTIGPVVFGRIYSWSLTNNVDVKGQESALGFPFNQYFTFLILAVLNMVAAVIVHTFPDSINKKRDADQTTRKNKDSLYCK